MASKILKLVSTSASGFKSFIPKYKHGTFRLSSTLGQHSVETTSQNDLVVADEQQIINPLQEKDFFGVHNLVTMKDLFDAKVHWGHKSGVRNILMRPFIFGTRLNIDIIDLEKTLPLLHDALNFTAHIAYREGIILFISRNKRTLHFVERAATDCKEYAQCRAWKDGTFTNATSEFGSITRLPDLCIFISTHDTVFQEHAALIEAAKCNIPSIGILDTSCDPRLITYPVPGNDDSPSSVELYCSLFKQAVLLGKNKRKEMQDKGIADKNDVDENEVD